MAASPEFLMCEPTHYTVRYEINPWMDVRSKPERGRAFNQWHALREQLDRMGARVHQIPPHPGFPDMVFTANAGLHIGETFIPSNFRFPQRQGERAHFISWFDAQGCEIVPLPETVCFEGQGDVLIFRESLVAGYRFRTDIQGHGMLGEIIGRELISVELVDPRFYHLDTCFCPLDDQSALFYPGAFDEYGIKALSHLVEHLIPVVGEDAETFCCNAIVLGKRLVINHCSLSLRKTLESLGFELFLLPFDQFIKAGGSAKCLVLQKNGGPPALPQKFPPQVIHSIP